ncbi:MAG: lysophospholipid acyltransferase family protein, partial [Acidimicrobiales bacterium]
MSGGGSSAAFPLDTRRSAWYRFARLTLRVLVRAWFRPVNVGREHIPAEGPAILAPVHRSFVDFVFTGSLTRRKLFFMAKDELWTSRPVGRLLTSLGAFPVHR